MTPTAIMTHDRMSSFVCHMMSNTPTMAVIRMVSQLELVLFMTESVYVNVNNCFVIKTLTPAELFGQATQANATQYAAMAMAVRPSNGLSRRPVRVRSM